MTTEIMERAAKAIAGRMAVRRNGCTLAPWSSSPERSEALDYAKAMLEELRYPTVEMLEAVYRSNLDIYWGYQADGRPGGPEDVWRAMLNTAIQEKSPIKE